MISIIVPIYNVEKYLSQCVESLMNQIYRDIEIILVDDGSPDRCPQLCDTYARKDPRIKVIHQKNAGVSAARNAGLQCASGEYIGFVDPDDWIEENMYKEMLTALEGEGADVAICGYNYYSEEGELELERAYRIAENETLTQKDFIYHLSDITEKRRVRLVVWNKLFKRSTIGNTIFNETFAYSEDVLFLSECIDRINKAVFVHAPLYCNRVRRGSATHGGLNVTEIAKSYEAHIALYNKSIEMYPEIKNHCQCFLLDALVLKYNECKHRFQADGTCYEKRKARADISKMRRLVRKYALGAMFNSEMYWKTRIAYILIG